MFRVSLQPHALQASALRRYWRYWICLLPGWVLASWAVAICIGSASAAEKPRSAERVAAKKSGASTASSEPASSFGIQQVELINKQIRQGWVDNELTPSQPATDEEWCRRVHLDIIGRIPTVDELEGFLKNKTPERKADLVNKLLDEDYVEEYARNWTTIWTNVLIGRTGGMEDRSLTSRPGMQQYLRRGFQRNKPYDKMVEELITANGSTVPGEEDFNGAANFLVGKYEEKAAQATAKSSQIFLGLQVQCTQCHNHPFNDWKQNQFWEMNAFFRQSRPLREFEGREIANVQLVDESTEGEDRKDGAANAVLFYELRNGLLKAAYPVFVDGTSLVDVLGEETGNSGYLEDVIRRQELAKLMLKSPYLDKAIVNRYWAHFLGYGFTKPIDDMGPHNPATHPELVAALGTELRDHSFDLKQLVRWIVLSEAYSLSSKMNAKNKKDDPSLGEKPMFSHFYLRQMQAEELYESLIVATEAQKAGGSDYEAQEKTKREWLQQFGIAFGTDEGDEATTFNGTIPQALMLMNGDLINKATSGEKGSFLDRVANNTRLNNSDKINYLYMASLSRKPSKGETGWANQLLAARSGDVVAALQDIWWVLLNTNEFIFNH